MRTTATGATAGGGGLALERVSESVRVQQWSQQTGSG